MQGSLNSFRRLVTRHPFYVAFGVVLILAILVGLTIAALILTGGIAAFPLLAIIVGAVATSIGVGAIAGATVATALAVGAVCSLGILALGVLLMGAAVFIIGPRRVFGGNNALLKPVPMTEVQEGHAKEADSPVPPVKLHEIILYDDIPKKQQNNQADIVVRFAAEMKKHLKEKGEADVGTTRSLGVATISSRMLNSFRPNIEIFQEIENDLRIKIAEAKEKCLSPQEFYTTVQQLMLASYDCFFQDDGNLRPEIREIFLEFVEGEDGLNSKIPDEQRELLLKGAISYNLLRAAAFFAVSPSGTKDPHAIAAENFFARLYQSCVNYVTDNGDDDDPLKSAPMITRAQFEQRLKDFFGFILSVERPESPLDIVTANYYMVDSAKYATTAGVIG